MKTLEMRYEGKRVNGIKINRDKINRVITIQLTLEDNTRRILRVPLST